MLCQVISYLLILYFIVRIQVDLIHEEGYEQAWRFRCKFNWLVAKNQNYAQTWS